MCAESHLRDRLPDQCRRRSIGLVRDHVSSIRIAKLQRDMDDFDSVRDYWERTQSSVSVSIAHVIKACAFIREIAAWNIGEPVITFDQLWAGQRIDQLATDSHRVTEEAINCVELVTVGPELRHVDVSAERPDD